MNEFSLSAINDRISEASEFVQPLRDGLQKKVVGQKTLLDKIIISDISFFFNFDEFK